MVTKTMDRLGVVSYLVVALLLLPNVMAASVGTTNMTQGKVVYAYPDTPVNYSSKSVNDSELLDGMDSSEFWQSFNAQVGLTGDKTGSFDLTTTGDIDIASDTAYMIMGGDGTSTPMMRMVEERDIGAHQEKLGTYIRYDGGTNLG